jgi:TRAP-type uncharacterized transport system substrate-binding protein
MAYVPPAIPLKAGGVPSLIPPGVGPIDPLNIRAKLMLETASHMMTDWDWPYREAVVEMRSQGDEIGSFRLFGANDPSSIQDVYDRKTDISILNPMVLLSMAHRGIGMFSHPMEVALIAVMPHYDQLGFAVTEKSGLTSLDDIREKRYPLRLSVRGSLDASTAAAVELVLRAHGFSYADIISWGGSVSYDQPMPPQTPPGHPSRMARVASGELDAIFEEGVIIWVGGLPKLGMRALEINDDRLAQLVAMGFKPGKLEQRFYKWLDRDIQTVDFSGWPIFTRADAPELVVRKFCEAMEARKASIPWTWGPIEQEELPLKRMVTDAPDTPLDVPFHPVAEAYWKELGYLG